MRQSRGTTTVLNQPGVYRDRDRTSIERTSRAEGEPLVFADPHGFVNPPHRHREEKLLAFLEGGMTVRDAGETYQCVAGDRLVIPGNVEHAAEVGPEGCTFFWSER